MYEATEWKSSGLMLIQSGNNVAEYESVGLWLYTTIDHVLGSNHLPELIAKTEYRSITLI